MEEFKPGQVISPQNDEPGTVSQQPSIPAPPSSPQPDVVQPTPQAPVSIPVAAQAAELPAQPAAEQAPEGTWQFHQEAAGALGGSAMQQSLDPTDEIVWTAAEFIAHDKSPVWYLALASAGVVASGLVYLLTRDKITTAIIAFALLAFGLFAARKPRSQTYTLDFRGLHVGQRVYSFASFKSFAIAEEGQAVSLVFMPLKRFMPPLTVHLIPEVEDRAVDFLAQILPFDQHHRDAVDSLMRRIRF